MKRLILVLAAMAAIASCNNAPKATEAVYGTVEYDKPYECDTYTTQSGKTVAITFVKHGSLMLDIDSSIVHIDPVSMFGTDYNVMPKADLVLVSHDHSDHLDSAAVVAVTKEGTKIVGPAIVAAKIGCDSLGIGETIDMGAYKVTGAYAYNYSAGHENFHPKGNGLGFVIDVDDLRIYVAGDTEDIPEMANLEDVDIAILPVNQPYTMTPDQAINAISMLKPALVYPYHYSETDLTPLIDAFKDSEATKILVRQMQ